MSFYELALIAVGLSADAFAVAACTGLTMNKATIKKAVIVGLYFGIFQGLMPLIGWLLATRFADKIVAFDHWLAFLLLCFIGGKMIMGSFRKQTENPAAAQRGNNIRDISEAVLTPGKMLPLAIATSIDALAVGVSLAFLRVSIIPSVLFIGVITFVLSVLGVKTGNIFGMKLKAKAEFAGGLILVLIGLKILIEHTAA